MMQREVDVLPLPRLVHASSIGDAWIERDANPVPAESGIAAHAASIIRPFINTISM